MLAAVVLLALAGGVAATQLPTHYEATARIILQPLAGNAFSSETTNSNQTATIAVETEAKLVSSSAVTKLVNADLHSDLRAGSSAVTASVPADSQIVEITYTASTARNAQRFAESYAEQFLNYRTNVAKAAQGLVLANLTKQSKTIRTKLNAAVADTETDSPQVDSAAKVRLYSSTLASLEAQMVQARTPIDQTSAIVTPAPLGSRSGLKPLEVIAGAAVLGLLLGLLFTVYRERVDDRIRGDRTRFIGGLPVLARIPRPRGKPEDPQPAAYADSIRQARTGLLAATTNHAVIALSALSDPAHSARVATQLARSLAAAGYRTVLVDGSIDGPYVSMPGTSPNQLGVADILPRGDLDSVTLSEFEGVQFLPAGRDPVASRELYSGTRIAALIAQLREHADYVLINTAPLPSGDGMASVLSADFVALVAAERRTTRTQIAEAHDVVERLGAEVVGLVVVRDRKRVGARKGSSKHVKAGPPNGEDTGRDSHSASDVLLDRREDLGDARKVGTNKNPSRSPQPKPVPGMTARMIQWFTSAGPATAGDWPRRGGGRSE